MTDEPGANDAPDTAARSDAATVTPSRSADRHRRRRTARRVILLVAAAVVAVVVAVALWVHAEASGSNRTGPRVIVTVQPGTGVDQLAGTLASKRVISNELAYRIWGVVHGAPSLAPGRYELRVGSSFAAVDQALGAGPNVFPITVPAGFTVAELAQRVGQLPGRTAGGFAALAASGSVRSPFEPASSTSLDGLLGAGSYTVVPGESDRQLLTNMVDRFTTSADSLGLLDGASRLGMTPYQVVTAASIVQKEGAIAKNMGPVARVILNRLAAGMPLQMDSTVLFAEGRDGGTVTAADLRRETPYNTYLNRGLTPTPIAFPSRAALAMAIDPPPGSWLYFVVVRPDGTEAFADTYAEQQANEALAASRGLP